MQVIGIALMFGGYILVYAAVAHGGKFATEPWAGLFADAYTGAQPLTGPAPVKVTGTGAPATQGP